MPGRPKIRARRIAQGIPVAEGTGTTEAMLAAATKHVAENGPPRKPPLSDEEYEAALLEMRDCSLRWARDLIWEREAKTIGASLHALDRVNSELDRLHVRQAGFSGGAVNVLINGFDPKALMFGNNLPTSGSKT
jgi:hypothetical protein